MKTIKALFDYLGNALVKSVNSALDFCNFIGTLCLTIISLVSFKLKLDQALFYKQLYEASCKLVFPLTVLTIIINVSVILFAGPLVKQFNLEQNVIKITNLILLKEALPSLIALTLAFHYAIRLIELTNSMHIEINAYEVQQHILSRILAICFAGPLLYLYIVIVNFIVIFFVLSVEYDIILPVYLTNLRDNLNVSFFILSIVKTLCFTLVVGLIASFYYHQFYRKVIPLYHTISRLMTRAIFWLIIVNIILVIFEYQMGN